VLHSTYNDVTAWVPQNIELDFDFPGTCCVLCWRIFVEILFLYEIKQNFNKYIPWLELAQILILIKTYIISCCVSILVCTGKINLLPVGFLWNFFFGETNIYFDSAIISFRGNPSVDRKHLSACSSLRRLSETVNCDWTVGLMIFFLFIQFFRRKYFFIVSAKFREISANI
jgi:hypothetical protein